MPPAKRPVERIARRLGMPRWWFGVVGLVAGVLIASALTGVASASGNVYIVDNTSANCSASGPGTPAKPFCTIAGAANVAVAGDTVLVQAGTYPGTGVNPKNSGVTFHANPSVTISGGTKAFSISSRSNIVISGFTISGTTSAGISISSGAGVSIAGNTFSATGSYGVSVSGGNNVTISNNTESGAGIPITNPASGIYLSGVSGGVVSAT